MRCLFGAVSVWLCCVFASTAAVHAAAGGDLAVARLRWDARDRPLGFIQFEPRLAWVVSSSRRGQKQTAYQVLVATDPAKLKPGQADLWDSRKVVSGDSINVRYGGPGLLARQRGYWTVRAWDVHDRPSAFATPSWWETGLFDEEWEGQWIGRPRAPGEPTDVRDRSVTHLRKAFPVAKAVKRARLYASAFGVYDISINGKRVGDQTLAPGYTDYEKRVLFQTYDVTSLVRRGNNVIGAIVGGGWCTAAPGGRAGVCGLEPPRLMVQLEVTLFDGSRYTVITDRGWTTHAGPIVSAHLTEGERYDARLEMPGWDEPGFDDTGWLPAAPYDKKKERDLVADPGSVMGTTEQIVPVNVQEPVKGTYVFDFGRTFVGRVRLRTHAEAGATITLAYGETLRKDGTVSERSGAGDSYTAAGRAAEVWEPRFSVGDFRYVQARGLRRRPDARTLTGLVVQSVMRATGQLATSDPKVDQLWRTIMWRQRSGFLSVPTAGPERVGAMLDAGIFAGTACLNADVQTFYRKWIDDLRDAQLPNAAYSTTAPATDQQAGGPGSAVAGVLVPWALHRCYADRTALDAHFPSMGRWLDALRTANPDLVWKKDMGTIVPGTLEQDSRTPGAILGAQEATARTDASLIGTAEIAYAAEAIARMMRHAGPGLEGEVRKYRELANAARAAFSKAFVLPDGKLKGDTPLAYALALALGVLPVAARERAGRDLVAAVDRTRGPSGMGKLGGAYLLSALSTVGRDDLAYNLLSRVGEDHVGGGVGEWMYDAIGGIALDPDAPAGRHVFVRPRPGGNLTHARARYDSLYGPVATEWRWADGTFRLKVSIPANGTATVTLPFAGTTTEGGVPAAGAPGVKLLLPATEGRGLVVGLESGSYEFVVATHAP